MLHFIFESAKYSWSENFWCKYVRHILAANKMFDWYIKQTQSFNLEGL
ncbi:hypothetical protein CKA32_002320 [Geitlerinema sp. FC II]|nr:hypothetical protein CKA32_002320 [Geitlerinema sp. FC II]